MPVDCTSRVLSGQDGAVYFRPPGTNSCFGTNDVYYAGSILELGNIIGGSGYLPGIYEAPLTYDGASPGAKAGTLGTAQIKVDVLGQVESVQIVNPGKNYAVGELLSAAAATIGGAVRGEIKTTGTLVGGTGYANGFYPNMPALYVTSGAGFGARVNITVSGGAVTAVQLVSGGGGQSYTVSDQLTAVIPGGTGFSFRVATIDTGGSGFKVPALRVATGSAIKVDIDKGYKVGDLVKFAMEGTGGVLPSPLSLGVSYKVSGYNKTDGLLSLVLPSTGAAITYTDSGTQPLAGHFNIEFSKYIAATEVRDWSFNYTRELQDTTPIGRTKDGRKRKFRRQTPNFLSGDGSMTLYWTDGVDDTQRLMLGPLQEYPADVQLYLKDELPGTGSRYIEGKVWITTGGASVNPDSPQQATVSFQFDDEPKFIGFGLD